MVIIKQNVSLKNFNSFRIEGAAKLFLEVKNEEELIEGIKEAKRIDVPFFILGGGSNILVSSETYEGLVIKISIDNIEKKEAKEEETIINVKAGTPLNKVVSFCLENDLSGMEWAIGIPGTIGGAVRGNAGAFGKSIQDNIVSVSFLDISDLSIKKTSTEDCQFDYRTSIFKKNPNWIVLGADFLLQEKRRDLIQGEISDNLKKRIGKQPKGFSAGSIFKNYQIKEGEKERILSKFPEMAEMIKNNLIPAGFLIESCGLKGKEIGDAIISEEHANFIVNKGEAKFEDVDKLIFLIKEKVKEKFGIILEEEVQRMNFINT